MLKKFFFPSCFFTLFLFLNASIAAPLEFNIAPWQLNPDGKWESIIYVTNSNSTEVKFNTSAGTVINLPPWVFNASAIRVILDKPQSIVVTAKRTAPPFSMGVSTILSPAETHSELNLSGKAIGPYLINLGFSWTGKETLQSLSIQRKTIADYSYQTLARLEPTSITFHDNEVKPNQTYQYKLVGITSDGQQYVAEQSITTPPPMKNFPVSTFSGKGIIMLFDMDVSSEVYYKKIKIRELIADAVKLGLRYIQIRSVYGSFSHFDNPDLVQWLDNLLDEASDNNIAVISWSIPRIETSRAIASDIAVASHTTAKGNTFAGISIDLEIGNDYIFQKKTAKEQMIKYMRLMNMALGKDYLLSAIVYTPYKSSYDNTNYPYAEIAKYVDIMQPMVFYHHYNISSNHVYTQTEVMDAIGQSILLTKKLSNIDIPVNVIAQITDLGKTGIPSPNEVLWAIQAAKNNNALGISFYDWSDRLILNDDSVSQQAETIKNFSW
ncbi:hypothetical protein ACQUW5_10815 [Legionella sp. CNM-1927-20]|uniref:hypothetical protein n=1 Tax=Legionella sp. CNM-1927-20 TaxID=3422221 RepID=UPI00403B01F3